MNEITVPVDQPWLLHVTHYEAIQKIVADPQAFIKQLVAKAKSTGLDGFDIDYEPQQVVHRARYHSYFTILKTEREKS